MDASMHRPTKIVIDFFYNANSPFTSVVFEDNCGNYVTFYMNMDAGRALKALEPQIQAALDKAAG